MSNIVVGKKGIAFVDKDGRPLGYSAAMKKVIARIFNWYLDAKLAFIHYISEHLIFFSLRKIIFKLAGLKIGKGSTIHMGVRFFSPNKIVIGSDSVIGFRTFLDGRASLVIGDHVDIASEVMIYNSEHDLESETFKAREEPVEIKDYVFVGPRAIIMPNVTIGRGAVVAAGAVVTNNVPDFTIVGGVPARVIAERRNKNPKYRLGRTRLFQ